MKKRILLIVLSVVTASSLSLTLLQNTHAADLTAEQIGRIRANCTSIMGSLNQLHASDALLRVNRGQIYETLGTKLMNNFNSRLSNNSLDNKGLVVVTNSYQTALAKFRTDYQTYEQQLSAAIRIDCTKSPSEFHASIELAREKRAIVRTSIVRLNQYIDDYRSAINDFMLNFERVTGKGA